MTNDELLGELVKRIDPLLVDLRDSTECYQYTQDMLTGCDVSLNEAYQRKYKGFYKLRLPRTDCYSHYFTLLELLKGDSDISYEHVLLQLQNNTGRIEASFASKLVATVNPKLPVIDSIVLECLSYKKPSSTQADQFQKTISLYQLMIIRFREMEQDKRFETLKSRFENAFPDYSFTDIKILDLLIWEYGKSRDRKSVV